MAGLNGMGPAGQGPMTGRGRGLCGTEEERMNRNASAWTLGGFARGMERGRGPGRGRGMGREMGPEYSGCGLGRQARRCFAILPDDTRQEAVWLTRRADMLEMQLAQVRNRLSQMDEKSSDTSENE